MATFKVIVENGIKQDNTYPVRIRVTHQRKPLYIPTEHYVTKSQIDKKFNIKDEEIAHILSTIIKDYRLKVNRLGPAVDTYNCKQLIEYVTKIEVKFIDYIAFATTFISGIKSKGSRDNAKTTLNSFKDFVGDNIDINEISIITINKYDAYIRSPRTITRSNNPGITYTKNVKGVTDTGVRDYMAKLKNWYIEAMKHYNDRDKVLVPYNPFDKYVAPKQVVTPDKELTVDQIISLRDCDRIPVGKYNRTQTTELARDVAMLSFYLVGMNAADLYYVDSYTNGRISYNRAKTASRRSDNAFISIRVEPEALRLVEKYVDPTGERVFKFHTMYNNHDGLTKALNDGLKEISKHLKWGVDATFIWLRYSWPNIARNLCKVPVDDVAQAMNHASDHKTTDIYLAKDWSIIDEANRKVLDYLISSALQAKKK